MRSLAPCMALLLASALALPARALAQDEEPTIEIAEEPEAPPAEDKKPDAAKPDAAKPAETPEAPPAEKPLDKRELKKREKTRSKLVKEGDALLKKNDAEGALAKYMQAYDTLPTPLLYYPMAKAEERLGRVLEAIAHYEQFLTEGEGLIANEDIRVDAQVSVQELEKRVVVVTFEVEPEGATVTIDDVEVGTAPLAKPVRLLPGKHRIVIASSGFKTVDVEQEWNAGDRPTETHTLQADRPVVEPEPEPEPVVVPKPRGKSGVKKAVLWTGIGLTGASLIGWAVTGSMALSEHDTFADPANPRDERASARDSGKNLALTSDILLVSTLVCGGFTAYWYYKVYNAPEKPAGERDDRDRAPPVPGGDDDDEPAELRGSVVVPWVSSEGGGLTWMGSF